MLLCTLDYCSLGCMQPIEHEICFQAEPLISPLPYPPGGASSSYYLGVLQICSAHQPNPADAASHYKAVCRALVTEALELISFLDKISKEKEVTSTLFPLLYKNCKKLSSTEITQVLHPCHWVTWTHQLPWQDFLEKIGNVNIISIAFCSLFISSVKITLLLCPHHWGAQTDQLPWKVSKEKEVTSTVFCLL